jgi:multiple sugar transport system permease protein/sn-glycerol 3-phosphate transport system permease protein
MAAVSRRATPGVQIGAVAQPRATASTRFFERTTPYLMIAPVILLMGLFIYWPLIYSAYLSLFDWNFVSPHKTFVGFDNYRNLWDNRRFEQSLRVTLVYVLALVPIQVILPLALALLLWPIRKSRAQSTYRVLLFTPTVISFSVGALLWLWIFHPLQGVLNLLLVEVGQERIRWLQDPKTAVWCVIVVSTWKYIGFNLLLFLAALEAVPNDYLEAAAIDGASGWQQIKSIRLPLITPTLFFVLVTTIISVNDEAFAAINVLTDGGPFERTANVVYYLYEQGFQFFQIGSASTVSLLLFLATVFFTWLQFRFVERHVHYG